MCLKVRVSERPGCQELLSNPLIVQKMNSLKNFQVEKTAQPTNKLMDTIRLTRNLNDLNTILPEPQYNKQRRSKSARIVRKRPENYSQYPNVNDTDYRKKITEYYNKNPRLSSNRDSSKREDYRSRPARGVSSSRQDAVRLSQ